MGFFTWLQPAEVRADALPKPVPGEPGNRATPPSRADSPLGVSQSEALSLASVYRAITILTTAATQIGVHVYRGGTEVRTPAFISKPNLRTSSRSFIESTVTGLAGNGNAFWLVDRDDKGNPVNLTVLNPFLVTINVDNDGNAVSYGYGDQVYNLDRVKHLALLRVAGSARGLGPIQAAQRELRGAIDTRDFAGNWFRDSGAPVNGVLKTDQTVTPEVAKASQEAWMKARSENKGPAVMGSGLDYRPLILSPKDALWVEAQQFNTTAVARLFGISSSMMLANVEGSSQTYANVEQEWIAFTRFTLMSYLGEIEDAFSELLPGSQRAKFNLDALLRSDTLSRYQAHAIGRSAGFLTVNEIRALENLPAVDGGDEISTPAPAPAVEPASNPETPEVPNA